MVKIYVTWNAFWIYSSGNKEAMHPTEAINRLWSNITFTELSYGNVETDKRMLGILEYDESKFSIEAIGYDCGFSSKSSFFSVFKNITGQTPVQFKNSNC